MYKWKVRGRKVRMKGQRRECTYESKRREMYVWKVRERNVRMKCKRKECTHEK